MSPDLPVLHLAEVTLETTTPLSLGTGAEDALFDTLLARDADGLPVIPGSSLAGVLRHLFEASRHRDAANAFFGLDAEEIKRRARARDRGERRPAEGAEAFEASLLQVCDARLHGEDDRPPPPGPNDLAALSQDPLFKHALAAQPIERDHVKLTERGVADTAKRGKFTRAALARGHRFSFELALWSEVRPDPRWAALRRLFARPDFRLGGGTRRGYGGVEVARWRERAFDLRERAEAESYRAHYAAAPDVRYEDFAAPAAEAEEPATPTVTATLVLTAEDFFRFGAGTTSLAAPGEARTPAKPADMLPLGEPRVVWRDGAGGRQRGELTDVRALVPASAVKGAIAHRLAFHHDRLAGRFLDEGDEPAPDPAPDPAADNPAVSAFFGCVRAGSGAAARGRVLVSDLLLEPLRPRQVARLAHNGLDRFTGGTRATVLYSEEMLAGCTFTLRLEILEPEAPALRGPHLRPALAAALADLAEGRLALGAGGSKGHGRFLAEDGVRWSDEGRWIAGTGEATP